MSETSRARVIRLTRVLANDLDAQKIPCQALPMPSLGSGLRGAFPEGLHLSADKPRAEAEGTFLCNLTRPRSPPALLGFKYGIHAPGGGGGPRGEREHMESGKADSSHEV